MDNKRKASGSNGIEPTGADTPDRAAKRRKLQEEFGDLVNGETAESTTAYGLNILESIRATTDKNGRQVAPYFETIPTKVENPEYYQKIRLPLSLEIIERKLNRHEYSQLSTLEGDFKRMVSNAKEVNPRNSEAFGDAERIRKAVSNLMTKHNPAYKAGNYQAVATPLPPTPGPDDAEEEEDAPAEEDDEITPATAADADADGAVEEPEEEHDAEGDDDDQEDEDEEPRPSRGGSKRRTGRADRNAPAQTRKASRSGSIHGKADSPSENNAFQGFSFQQAQEKIIDELIRKKDETGDYPYFEPFLNLPPRSLKDYYDIIAEPLCLKKLQKQVRGVQGRNEVTGVSHFKAWAAFEDQASLIWKNAYHYNEDGSDIFVMAQELEELFKKFVAEAKQQVPEPSQPRIKLKVPEATQPKKITIHVGGKASTGSPAPATVTPGDGGESARNGTPIGRNPFGGSVSGAVNVTQLEKARSMSVSGASPSPSVGGTVKPEDTARQSPAILPQLNSITTQQQFVPVAQPIAVPSGVAAPPPPPLPPAPKLTAAEILEAQKYRPHPIKEAEALMPKLTITSHPSLQLESRLALTIPASATETQQELVFNAPASYFRLQLRPQVAPYLEAQQREWKLNVMHDFQRQYPSAADSRNEPVFDITLRYGTNRLEISLVAALPKGETGPQGLTMTMERFVVHFNLLKHH